MNGIELFFKNMSKTVKYKNIRRKNPKIVLEKPQNCVGKTSKHKKTEK